ncbi:MAG: hypothetical protein ACYSUC_05445 [Planctomycetota bacterium]|jgi:hypothetical protein
MLRRSGCRLASFILVGILLAALADGAGACTIMGNVDSYEKDGYNTNCDRKRDFFGVRAQRSRFAACLCPVLGKKLIVGWILFAPPGRILLAKTCGPWQNVGGRYPEMPDGYLRARVRTVQSGGEKWIAKQKY